MLASFEAWHYIEFAPFIASIPGYFLGELPGCIFTNLSIFLRSQEIQERLK